MHYSIYNKKRKQVPGIMVIAAVLFLVVGLGFVLQKDYETQPHIPNTDISLERVDIANVRDRSFTVFWRTNKPTTGYIEYSVGSIENGDIKKAFDSEDSQQNLQPRHNHVVHIKGLQPGSDVEFRVVADDTPLGQAPGVPFAAQTTRVITSPLEIDPVYGDVVRQSGRVEKDAVVIMKVGQAKPLITRTHDDGTFLFSLCCLFHSQTNEPIIPSDDTSVQFNLIAEDGTEKVVQGTLDTVSPLAEALVINGEVQDFTLASSDSTQESDDGTSIESDENVSESQSDDSEVLAVADSIDEIDDVDVIFPKDDAAIPGTRPLVRGVGEPGELVKGHFVDAGRFFQIDIDEDRNWVYEPSFDLSPGEHELNVETVDKDGDVVTFNRAFTILKSGQAVLQASTPSGTLTPTEIPTATPSPTITSVPTDPPTFTPTPPVSGINILPITIVSILLLVMGAGIILLF